PTGAGRLPARYGECSAEVLAPGASDPGLLEAVPGAEGYLWAEVRYAVTHEGALHVGDVLDRRTRAAMESPDRGVVAAEPVARAMGEIIGWDQATVEAEVAGYRRRVEAELAAEDQPDDISAERARAAGAGPGRPGAIPPVVR
ncbi:MAG: glycerol-3-phosphate dehydrogenase C-terminal domain-containing protein, partial [Acidimicrobiales bacterium]